MWCYDARRARREPATGISICATCAVCTTVQVLVNQIRNERRDPALTMDKSDSCPQLYKKTTFGTKKRLLAPSKTVMVAPTSSPREPVRAAAAAERRVHLQTGRCCRARFVGVDAAARSGRIGGAAQLLLFEVANIRIRSPPVKTAGGPAILTCCCAQLRHRKRQRALPPPTLQLPGRLIAMTIQRAR